MHPTIKDGETITVEPVKPSGIKRGDIVLYRLDKGVIAHRVVRIEKNDGAPLFILRGDALGAQDEAAAVQQVLGKVVSVQRGGRSIDLYSRRAKMVRIAYVCVSRLRRWMMPT
jgi:signal peptidase